MMKKLILYLAIIQLFACKEDPNYNPFDDQFDVSVNRLVHDKCDTIPAGCGYFNLTQNSGRLRPYYQIYIQDFQQVVAKGFIYELDTFAIHGDIGKIANDHWMDSMLQLPVKVEEMNAEFGRFGYKILDKMADSMLIVNTDINDTVVLDFRLFPSDDQRFFIRSISYFTSENRRR